ncbi:hypothetical protein ACIA5C_36930 [Actinoplanes sp. NPDC051343]|uniref:hypothetical protein n=1 Tax=Actinoplanes sp. NPDC051343 TaxID=3363906 RepID=UPI0037B29683
MPAIAVPAFALTWWLACYLVGRDPARAAGRRAAGALIAYAAGVIAWTLAPGSTTAEVLLAVPALFWAGSAVALLPSFVPERRQIERGWLVVSAAFVVIAVVLPPAGRLVVLAPLLGGLSLLWRFRDQVEPRLLPLALSLVAVLYGTALALLVGPADLGAPWLAIAAIGVDVLILGYLVAVAEAVDAGERLRPDLSRSLVAAVGGLLLVGGPVILTMFVTSSRMVAVFQFAVVGVVMTAIGLGGPVHRLLDRVAFWSDERVRADRHALFLLGEALPRRRERSRMLATTEADFLQFVLQALDSYGDPGRLLRSPLIDLPAVDRRLLKIPVEQPLARAHGLRHVLEEAVAGLRPAGKFSTDEEWRHYNAVYFCSLLGLQPYSRRKSESLSRRKSESLSRRKSESLSRRQNEGLSRRPSDDLDLEARRTMEWIRQYVPRHLLRRWQSEGAARVARDLWDDMVSTDPRWLTRLAAGKRPTTTRST